MSVPGTAPNSARAQVMLNVGQHHKTVMPSSTKLVAGDLLLRQAGLSTFSRGHSRATSIDIAMQGIGKVDLNVQHAVDSLATGGVSIQVLSQMFRQTAGNDQFLKEHLQVMLDDVNKTPDLTILFKDLYGCAWEVVRRKELDLFEDFVDFEDEEPDESKIIGSHLVELEVEKMTDISPLKQQTSAAFGGELDEIKEHMVDEGELRSYRED